MHDPSPILLHPRKYLDYRYHRLRQPISGHYLGSDCDSLDGAVRLLLEGGCMTEASRGPVTLQEARELREQAEYDVLEIIMGFEKATGLVVAGVRTQYSTTYGSTRGTRKVELEIKL